MKKLVLTSASAPLSVDEHIPAVLAACHQKFRGAEQKQNNMFHQIGDDVENIFKSGR